MMKAKMKNSIPIHFRRSPKHQYLFHLAAFNKPQPKESELYVPKFPTYSTGTSLRFGL
jgi:hypothetical protein